MEENNAQESTVTEPKPIDTRTIEEREPLEIVAAFKEAHRDGPSGGFCFGYGHKIPPTAEGYRAALKLMQAARAAAETPLAETGETGGRLAAALRASGRAVSPMGLDKDSRSLSYSVSVPRGALSGLPSGCIGDVPKEIVRSDLVGVEVTDAEGLISSMGACTEGAVAFLDRFSISYEQDPGDDDCHCSCGECGDGERSGDLSYGADFTLTAGQPALASVIPVWASLFSPDVFVCVNINTVGLISSGQTKSRSAAPRVTCM